MTLNQLASKIAKIEGKKSQARIGDIREILKIYFDLFLLDEEVIYLQNREMDKRLKKHSKQK